MMPYAPPQNNELPKHSASAAARFLSVVDFVLGAVMAFMTIDYPIVSLVVLVATSTVAVGLFRTHEWGWWAGIALHSLILAGATIGYVVFMIHLVDDFGRPPNHMSIISAEGAAVILTIIYAVVAVLAALPVFVLRSRRCRSAFGTLNNRSSE